MSNRTARPFEAGDLVVVFRKISGQSIFYKTSKVKSVSEQNVYLHDNTWFGKPFFIKTGIGKDCPELFIKTIRKPRKGSKEARDIVAKIGWMYLMDYKKSKKAVFNSEEYHYFLKIYSSKQQCYLVAKSMLK